MTLSHFALGFAVFSFVVSLVVNIRIEMRRRP